VSISFAFKAPLLSLIAVIFPSVIAQTLTEGTPGSP